MASSEKRSEAQRILEFAATRLGQGDLNASRRALDMVLGSSDSSPSDRAAVLVLRGVVRHRQGDTHGALSDATEATKITEAKHEWKWKAFFHSGQLKLELLDFQGAVDALTTALQFGAFLAQDEGKAILLLARGKVGIRDLAGAKAELLKLINRKGIDPTHRQQAKKDLQALERIINGEEPLSGGAESGMLGETNVTTVESNTNQTQKIRASDWVAAIIVTSILIGIIALAVWWIFQWL